MKWFRANGSALALAVVIVAAPLAMPASAAAKSTKRPVTIVTLNLLHGLFCPPETDSCQAPDRVELFGQWLERVGCPDLVGIQEVGARLGELLPQEVPAWCDGDYEIAWAASAMPDRAMVLTRLPIVEQGALDIANVPWEAYWVRTKSPQGPVDFLTAHFASSSNNPPCNENNCPPVCPAGTVTNECHGIEVADFFAKRTDAALTVVGGDLNATPDEATVGHLRDAGFVDAWLESGRPECDATHRAGCTSGGSAPDPWVGMNTKEGAGFDERIDYVWVKPGKGCSLRTTAKGFATTAVKAPVHGMWWPSDHGGVHSTLRCA
jgi:endonuclease/exonuclease/phosphatase family metal-dependent hydrolase